MIWPPFWIWKRLPWFLLHLYSGERKTMHVFVASMTQDRDRWSTLSNIRSTNQRSPASDDDGDTGQCTSTTVSLKVVSAILGRNINNYINLIFPHDPLATRLWLVVPLVIVCDLGAQAAYRRVFLMAGLWGGQVADHEESDHLYFSLESLIQPLRLVLIGNRGANVWACEPVWGCVSSHVTKGLVQDMRTEPKKGLCSACVRGLDLWPLGESRWWRRGWL